MYVGVMPDHHKFVRRKPVSLPTAHGIGMPFDFKPTNNSGDNSMLHFIEDKATLIVIRMFVLAASKMPELGTRIKHCIS